MSEKIESTSIDKIPFRSKKTKRKLEEVIDTRGSKKQMKGFKTITSDVTLEDIVVDEKTIEDVYRVITHMKHPQEYTQSCSSRPRGLLLHGPSGSGKTLLAHAIAGELRLPIFNVTSSDLASKKPEKQLAAIFEQAVAMAPCILFIDEIDRILLETVTTGRKKTSSIVTQLSTCMDGLGQKKNKANVLVIAATKRPDSLDKDLRLAGRFDSEIALGKPNEPTREKMLQAFFRHLPYKLNLDWKILAKKTADFNGADLKSLTDKVINVARERFTRLGLAYFKEKYTKEVAQADKINPEGYFLDWFCKQQPLTANEIESLGLVTEQDFIEVLKDVEPSA